MPTLPTTTSPTTPPTAYVPSASSAPTMSPLSAVLSTPPASNTAAIAHFTARLSYEADVSDVHADTLAKVPNLLIVDSRSLEAWDQGHLPDALHMPTAQIATRAPQEIPPGTTIVTYCWGPGCNGATRAALEFATLGYPVKEMIGGYEYWVREGFPYDTKWGTRTPTVDPLTAPSNGTTCAC